MFAVSKPKSTRKVLWLAVGLLLTAVLLIFFSFQTGQIAEQRYQSALEFRLGLPLQPSSGLLIVALEKGFFKENGLKVIVREYPSGKRSLNEGLFQGEVDVVSTADFPVTIAAMHRKDFRIIASTFSANDVNSIIARKDAGIEKATDLKGKHIGTQKGSAVHYFLYLFLLEQGLSEEDVVVSFMKAEELPQALADGRIDAFSMREPYIGEAKELLGENAVLFSAPRLYEQQELLVVSAGIIRENSTLSHRILKSLFEAGEYINKNPEAVVPIIAKRLHATPGSLAPLWPEFQFRLSLNQSLLVSLEDQARWAIRDKLVEAAAVPNYLEVIQLGDLQELRADTVTIH